MSDQNFPADLDDLLAQLDGVSLPGAATAEERTQARLVVATDWSQAAVPLTLLKAFRAIVPPGLPIQLAFAVPHEPTEADAACVQVLVDGVDSVGISEPLAGLEILSFDNAAAEPYDAAVVPIGNPAELITQVGGLIVRMHDLVRRMERSGPEPVVNQGDGEALRFRLAAFIG